ncbi:MAG: hypothetical protein V1839_01590 [archaeon]
MFHLTHMYCTAKSGSNNAITILGSALPDIGGIPGSSQNWRNFIGYQKWFKNIENDALKKGFFAHAAADEISHGKLNMNPVWGTGWAFKWSEKLFPYFHNHHWHSLGELSMEIYVAKTHPDVLNLFNKTVKSVNLKKISEDIAQAMNADKKAIYRDVRRFVTFMILLNNLVTKPFKILANPKQGRAQALEACLAAVKRTWQSRQM